MFKKEKPLDPSTLPSTVIFRFLEIEINEGINRLATLLSKEFTSYQTAQTLIIKQLAPNLNMLQDDLEIAFNTLKFRKPSRDELVQYFRYKNVGVARIAKHLSLAPNTIQTYKDNYPSFTPVFPSWSGFPQLLNNWKAIKSNLNLFNEILIHTKNDYDPSNSMDVIIQPEEMPELIEKEESLEPITQWECAEIFPMPSDFDPIISTYIMIQWNIAINGTTERLDQHLRDMIYNHELDSYLVPVIPYIQDHEEKKKLKDFLKLA